MGECADDAVFGDMDDEFRIEDDIDFDRYHDQRSRQPQARKVMDKQQHALRLAEWLEESHNSMDKLSAAELRRLHQSEQEGWRWAKECEAEVKRLRTLLAEGGQGCSECGVTVGEGYALYCVKCVEPLFAKEWVSLTKEERTEAANNAGFGHINIALEIEAKLKEKNT